MSLRTRARTSTTSPVSTLIVCDDCFSVRVPSLDGGWLKAHPIPSDKGSFGNFEALAQQNRRILQQILSEDASTRFSEVSALASTDYDEQILKKIRGLYASCLDEDRLNDIGEKPLQEIADKIRSTFRGKSTVIDKLSDDDHAQRARLTATVAFLHSRGRHFASYGTNHA